jgi:TatD DNase family protein
MTLLPCLSLKTLSFIDIGANLLDPMFRGVYRDKRRHPSDWDQILQRSWDNHLEKIVVTAGSLEESREALAIARSHPSLYCTVGVHPTRCSEFGTHPSERMRHTQQLLDIISDGMSDGKVVALGELGLDYERTEFCDVETQKAGLLDQLMLAQTTGLPIFVHNRNTGTDLYEILRQHEPKFTKAVIHSFDDTYELAMKFISLKGDGGGIYIGINGCSLKTEENLNVVRQLPLDKLMLETDCPWCDIRPTHASFVHVKTKFPTKPEKKWEEGYCVKSRTEPCHIIQVAEVIAGVKGCSVEDVANACYQNSLNFYGFLN